MGSIKQSEKKSLHSICRWTFNAGKGGFVPDNIRPEWGGRFSTVDFINLVGEFVKPRLPKNVVLGVELHYDNEINETNAKKVIKALKDNDMYLAMITPGAHKLASYGGIASMDQQERTDLAMFGCRTLDIAYNLKDAWHAKVPPTFVIWNGSFGYDLETPAIKDMYDHLKRNIAEVCIYERNLGGQLFKAIEPKGNEGHAAMLLPTVASAIVFWKRLHEQYKISLAKTGVNKEFGHTEMLGLDTVYDTVEELDNNMLVHMHLNSQGYNDGITLGGPGKFDIDNGVKINAANISIARLIQDAGYSRWKGHDMQPRPYDNAEQAIDRVVESILNWEACADAAKSLDMLMLNGYLQARETAGAERMMGNLVSYARRKVAGWNSR
jgi:xylose isomerase